MKKIEGFTFTGQIARTLHVRDEDADATVEMMRRCGMVRVRVSREVVEMDIALSQIPGMADQVLVF